MENRNIIIILFVIIVVLAAAVAFVFFNPTAAKEATTIKITSDKEQYEGGELSVKLADLNKTPIDSKGKAKLDLKLKKGKYTVNVTYGGNENYTGNNTTQKLTIKEKVVEETVSQSDYDGNQRPSYYDKIKVHRDPVSGGSTIDLSQLSEDEFAQYLGYSDAEEAERETERKRQEAYARHGYQ